jgi:hypothetical protein
MVAIRMIHLFATLNFSKTDLYIPNFAKLILGKQNGGVVE